MWLPQTEPPPHLDEPAHAAMLRDMRTLILALTLTAAACGAADVPAAGPSARSMDALGACLDAFVTCSGEAVEPRPELGGARVLDAETYAGCVESYRLCAGAR